MAFRSVFLLWKHELFHESVRRLLQHPEVEIVGSTCDYNTARDQILALRPDAVLIEETTGEETYSLLAHKQGISWNLRMFSLNMEDNHLRSLEVKLGEVEQADDLLKRILQE